MVATHALCLFSTGSGLLPFRREWGRPCCWPWPRSPRPAGPAHTPSPPSCSRPDRKIHTGNSGAETLRRYSYMNWFLFQIRNKVFLQCCESMTCWCGSGSADPCLWLMDTDPDPAIFVIDLHNADKKLNKKTKLKNKKKFFCLLLFEGTFILQR